MIGCKPSKTPIELGNKGKMLEGGPDDNRNYQRFLEDLFIFHKKEYCIHDQFGQPVHEFSMSGSQYCVSYSKIPNANTNIRLILC